MSVQALINKLVSLPSTTNELQFSGPGFDKSKLNLQQRLPTLPEPTLIALAAFLRYVNLDTFTDSELILLASIDFTSVDTNSYKAPKGFKFGSDSYYDIDGLTSNSLNNNFTPDTSTTSDGNDFKSLLYINKNTNLTYLAVLLSNIL